MGNVVGGERLCYPERVNQADNQPISEEEAFSPDGVDLTLIHWFLKLTPAQRLAKLQESADSLLALHHAAQHGRGCRSAHPPG